MIFQRTAPGIQVVEVDRTVTVPAQTSAAGGIAGVFRWGPADQISLINSEDILIARYGKPTDDNYETFFAAADFLSYGDQLYVVRAIDDAALSSLANTGTVANALSNRVKNNSEYESVTFDANVAYLAKYVGELGDSLKVSVCDSANAYHSFFDLTDDGNEDIDGDIADTNITFVVGSKNATVTVTGDEGAANTVISGFLASLTPGDLINAGSSTLGKQKLKLASTGSITQTGAGANTVYTTTLTFTGKYTLAANASVQTVERFWEHYEVTNRAPGVSQFMQNLGLTTADEMHVVVIDEDGLFTGKPNTILEAYRGLSRATDAIKEGGAINYYAKVINDQSAYIWWANDRDNADSAISSTLTASTNTKPLNLSFTGGADSADESSISVGKILSAYDLFKNKQTVDIGFLIAGKSRGGDNSTPSDGSNNYGVVANYLIGNIAEVRRDVMVFVSPARQDVVQLVLGHMENVIAFRNNLTNSSFALMDSGYKYRYDKYNDVYRYVPLNGDIAGLATRTFRTTAPWYSLAGYNRGIIKNLVKLAWSPNDAEASELYRNSVNSVITEVGAGTVLLGDKTLLNYESAFDRYNVRMLFIFLQKNIVRSSRSHLFEINDEIQRALFRNQVEPFLRDVQGRRGIYDFKVVCDETNNTGEVIDRNEFHGHIYVKPARSINYIILTFVATRTGVEFNELIGGI